MLLTQQIRMQFGMTFLNNLCMHSLVNNLCATYLLECVVKVLYPMLVIITILLLMQLCY